MTETPKDYLPYPESPDGNQDSGGDPKPDVDEPVEDGDDDGRPDR